MTRVERGARGDHGAPYITAESVGGKRSALRRGAARVGRPQMNGALRERDLDPLGAVAVVQPLDEFVADEMLVHDFPAAQDHREVDARVAERIVANEWFELGDTPFTSAMTSFPTAMVTASTRARSLS